MRVMFYSVGFLGLIPTPVFLGFPCGSAGKESVSNAGDLGSIPRLGRSPLEGKGYPLQYSGLENSIDCIVHGVAKSWTQLRTSIAGPGDGIPSDHGVPSDPERTAPRRWGEKPGYTEVLKQSFAKKPQKFWTFATKIFQKFWVVWTLKDYC